MSKTDVAAQVETMAAPIAERHGMELVDVEFVKEAGNWYLRVFIDKPGGISLDDCQDVSEELGKVLDERDPIPQNYMLEVSSPGLDRPLKKEKDFKRYEGRKVRVHTFAPFNGKKEFTGELAGLRDNEIVLLMDGETLAIPRDKAAIVRLEVEF
ncbi:MAG: ribosome maturation factor RimP [Bacillota bacterium]